MEFETRVLLGLSLAAGVILSLLHVVFSVDMYRDSANVYAMMARSLSAGDWTTAFHPGIPCLNVLLSRPFTLCGMRPERALSLVSGLFYVGTVPFLFLLLKQFLPERLSAVGALLFVCAPKIIRFSCSSIIDSGKIFFLVAGLFLLHKLIREEFRSPRTGIAFGLALGGLSLARSEGIGTAGLLALAASVYFAMQWLRTRKLPSLLPAAGAAVFLGLCLLFRVVLMRAVTGEFVFDRRIEGGLERMWNGLTSSVSALFSAPAASSTAAPGVPAVPMPPAVPRVSWMELVSQSIRGGYEFYLVFAAAGLILLILANRWKNCECLFPGKKFPFDLKWNGFFYVLLFVVLGNALIFKASDIAAYRYFLLDIPVLMVFTVTGFAWLWSWGEKFVPRRVLCCAAACVLLLQVFNGATYFFSKESKNKYACGRELARMFAGERKAPRVWFHNASIEWYYSGLRRARPIEVPVPDVRTFADFDYVLWGTRESGVDILASRSDLREIPLRENATARLFKKIR